MFDVVIVGAGISGLYSAFKLQDNKKRVVVFEARNRIGGRLHSEKGIDLGATWFWPTDVNINSLVRDFNLITFPQYTKGAMIYDLKKGVFQIANNFAGAYSQRIKGGMNILTDTLSNKLEPDTVRLNTKVKSISLQSNSKIKVGLNNGEFVETSHVIVALPPLLAVNDIDFEPKLPKYFLEVASNTPVWMGAVTKAVIIYESPFWRESGFSGSVISEVGPLREIHDISDYEGKTAAIFGFIIKEQNDSTLPSKKLILEQMIRVFGKEASDPEKVILQDWSEEKETSPANVHNIVNFNYFGNKLYLKAYFNENLHFSSAETGGLSGHIEDALVASKRAVGNVLRKQ